MNLTGLANWRHALLPKTHESMHSCPAKTTDLTYPPGGGKSSTRYVPASTFFSVKAPSFCTGAAAELRSGSSGFKRTCKGVVVCGDGLKPGGFCGTALTEPRTSVGG